jgi:hypothetical protein
MTSNKKKTIVDPPKLSSKTSIRDRTPKKTNKNIYDERKNITPTHRNNASPMVRREFGST